MFYDTTKIVFVIPPGKEITFLEKISKPFRLIVWCCFTFFFIVAAVVIRLTIAFTSVEFQKLFIGQRTIIPLWNLINLIFNGAINSSQVPRTNFARFVLMKLLIFLLILRSAYTGALLGFLQNETKVSSVNNINDVFEKHFTFYVSNRSGRNSGYLVHFDDIKETLTSVEQMKFMFDQLLENSEYKGVFSWDLDIILFENNKKLKSGLKPYNYLDENLLNNPRTVALHKNSPFLKEFNNHIAEFQASGLFVHWKRTFLPKESEILRGPKSISLDKVLGLMEILLVGYTFAFIVLLFEILHKFFLIKYRNTHWH